MVPISIRLKRWAEKVIGAAERRGGSRPGCNCIVTCYVLCFTYDQAKGQARLPCPPHEGLSRAVASGWLEARNAVAARYKVIRFPKDCKEAIASHCGA